VITNTSQQRAMDPGCVVRIDRIQIVSDAPGDARPPRLCGFRVVRDSFAGKPRPLLTPDVAIIKSMDNAARIFWQHSRIKPWLAPWKITVIPDDRLGLSADEMLNVVQHCPRYRVILVEVAVDFPQDSIVNRRFVLKYGTFGKSRSHD
jgi:hypothetical protein